MHSLTLICTRHEELGACNVDTLYEAFKLVKPRIIFEELPASKYNEYHISNTKSNLETQATNRYKCNNTVELVLVDAEIDPGEIISKYEGIQREVNGSINRLGFDYRSFVDSQKRRVFSEGFVFLNSKDSEQYNSSINRLIKEALILFNNDEYSAILDEWEAVILSREESMIENIYEYCSNFDFEKGVFLIGASHRQSIIEKIRTYNESAPLKINWENVD